MSHSDFLFTNALLIDPGTGTFGQRDLLVRDGRVEATAPTLAPYPQWKRPEGPLEIYDLKGYALFPGLVDIHVQVEGRLPVVEGHAIGHRVKRVLRHSDLGIVDVLVHLEPHEESDGE